MGFAGLAPFDNASAVYDVNRQVLTLAVEGEAQNYSYGFNFRRTPWAGGLRFELWDWSGPIGTGSSEFKHEQKFDIPSLSLTDPSNTVIVVGSNHPEGKVIDIKFVGLKPSIQGKPSAEKPAPPKTIDVPTPNTIHTLVREPFVIQERVSSGPGSTLNIQFDPQNLVLQSADVDDGIIYWKFISVSTGRTQVATYRTEREGAPVIRKVYTVDTFVLDGIKVPEHDDKHSNGASNGSSTFALFGGSKQQQQQQPSGFVPLSFLGFVNTGVRIAQRALSSAKLLRVRATLPAGDVYPVTDPRSLTQLELLLVGDDSRSVSIRSAGWGEWNQPTVTSGNYPLGLQTYDINDCKVDIVQAVQNMRKAGITLPFFNASLTKVLGNPKDGPYDPTYNFSMLNGTTTNVNAVNGKVNN